MSRLVSIVGSWLVLLLVALLPVPAQADADDIWAAMRAGNHIIFLRHAQTEAGIGDPPGFRIGDCTSQRNLSDPGRTDAHLIGEKFRERKVVISNVLSSHWCRCLDTARLAFGRVTPAVMLDSMFNDQVKPDHEKDSELQAYLRSWKGAGNLVLVTHAQNIVHWTGISPRSGEMVIARFEAGQLRVLGQVDPLAR